jgi:hypothetical protein
MNWTVISETLTPMYVNLWFGSFQVSPARGRRIWSDYRSHD